MGQSKVHSPSDLARTSTGNRRLNAVERETVWRAVEAGQSRAEIALQFGITEAYVGAIVRRARP